MFVSTATGRSATYRLALALLASCCFAACEGFVGSGPTVSDHDAKVVESEADGGWPAASAAAGAASGAKANADPSRAKADAGSTTQGATKPAGKNGSSGNAASACSDAPQRAQAVLTTYCGACHSNPATAQAGFSTILDVPALLSSGKVVSGESDMSPIWMRMSAGNMPPAGVKKRPSDADITTVREWIECGADDWNAAAPTQAFIGIDERLHTVLDDLRSIPNPADRQRMRYLDLSALANAGDSADELQVYREAVSFLMNSLSRGLRVAAPKAVDQNELIYRIDLRDYSWDAARWTQLEASYPYAMIYDENSRLYPFDEVAADQIRRETNTEIPIIQGDWFLSHASRPPLYYTLLDLSDSLDGLAQQLGVDIERDIETQQVLRAGFANAGPSQNNRVIERHDLGGNRGALWLSYDFSTNLDNKNIFAHPLDFQQDGGEMIFNLDNGLQGYFIANAAGTRLDKAPNNIVQDPAARDGAVEAGLSCMNCHQKDGQLPKYDEIRDFQLNAGPNASEIDAVLALYVPASELMAAFDADQNRYRSARTVLGISHLSNTTLHELDDQHLGILDLDRVASVIGLTADELERAIDASPQALPPEIVTLRTRGGGIQRDSFESIVGDLVRGLGLGQPLRVDASGARRAQQTAAQRGAADGGVDAGASAGSADAGSSAASPDAGTATSTSGGRRR